MSSKYQKAADVLWKGGVIAYPTEAVFGLGCDPKNIEAVKKILALKHRNPNKGLILIASNIEQLDPYVDISKIPQHVLDTWPGFITWLLPVKNGVEELLCGDHDTIAVRVTSHPDVIKICNAFGGAITSTSANLAGEDPIEKISSLIEKFDNKLDFIIEGNLGGANSPSKIIDSRNNYEIRS